MGILVQTAVLPTSNIQVSNVYMSFSGSSVSVFKDPMTSTYKVSSNYNIYSNPEKQPLTNISEFIITPYDDMTKGVYDVLYTELKRLYNY
jgi:hypothetical protein